MLSFIFDEYVKYADSTCECLKNHTTDNQLLCVYRFANLVASLLY